MPEEVRLWMIEEADRLREIRRSRLDLEARIEAWLERDISVLDPGLLVIGRQVETDFGGFIDLLCLDGNGDIVVVELKRAKTPREITAQVLDYGSWVKDLSNDAITEIADQHLGQGELENAFRNRFGAELPDTLNEKHRLVIVASEIDASSERIIKYLSDTYGVNVNAATFQYFTDEDGSEILARVFVLEPAQVELSSRKKGASKRRPNLTYEELRSIAESAGVGELYHHAVAGLERHLQKHTTRSSIGFAGNFDGSRKTIVSLIPEESTAADGLRFQVYFHRLRGFFRLSDEAVLSLLPPQRQPWIYYEGAGSDYEGFQGFFTSAAEIDRFIEGLAAPEHAAPANRFADWTADNVKVTLPPVAEPKPGSA